MTFMILRNGFVFNCAPHEEVEQFLRGRQLLRYELPPEKLHVGMAGSELTLRFCNGRPREYPVRRSFLCKLLQWYSFPRWQLRRLSDESVVSIANDYLLAMKCKKVIVHIEDGEALTLTGPYYSELSDLAVLHICNGTALRAVSRDDFLMRIYSETRIRTEPIPGDECGFGFNVINSETGFHALDVRSYILRYRCTNGAVAPASRVMSRRVHRHQKEGALEHFLHRRIRAAARGYERLTRKLAESNTIPATRQRKETEERLRRIIGKKEAEDLLKQLPDEATRYDLFNLVTAEAKRFDIATRLKLEMLAGRIVVEHRRRSKTPR